MKAYKKRKAEIEAERNTKRREELPRQPGNTERGFIAFTNNFSNLILPFRLLQL